VEVRLPTAIVANSIMLTDKYPFFKKELNEFGIKIDSFPNYKYLGVRNIAQNASTRAYVRKTVEFIVQQIDSLTFRKGLIKATKFLGLAEAIEIFYYTSNTVKFFKGDLSPIKLDEYFQKIKSDYAESTTTPPYKLQYYLKIAEDKKLVSEVCNFCNGLYEKDQLIKIDRSSIKKINYDIVDYISFERLKEDFEMLEHLRQLGMIYPPEIQLKRTDGYTLQESSSGEYHFFSSMVGLMATVKANSLIFIDEPEISLHPNWQMQYFSFLRELFSDPEFSSSHLFVATHSHFLISDLEGRNSKIIGLKRVDGKIEIVNLPKNINTFGWSAEQILLEIFRVSTTRNYFIAEKIGDILELVSEVERDDIKIGAMVKELINYNIISLSNEDPLKPVVNRLIEKYA
jgi:hypothetical protein